MTTAHRATWKAARGGIQEEGSFRLHVPSAAVSAKDAPTERSLKTRNLRDLSRHEMRTLLEHPTEHPAPASPSREASPPRKRSRSRFAPVEEPSAAVRLITDGRERSAQAVPPPASSAQDEPMAHGRAQHELGDARHHEDVPGNDDDDIDDNNDDGDESQDANTDSNSTPDATAGDDLPVVLSIAPAQEDGTTSGAPAVAAGDTDSEEASSSEEEEDEAELLAEMERIRKERAFDRAKKHAEQQERHEREHEARVASANPLLANLADEFSDTASVATGSIAFSVRRRWDDDVVFRNQAGPERASAPRFINDTIRNDFHRRFMKRYMR